MKRLLKVIVALLTAVPAALAPVPSAHASQTWSHAQGRLVDVRILENNSPMPLYSRGWGWNPDRRYFQAFEGGHYAVELRNLTNRRIAVVMSVDGLNVLSGQRSCLARTEPMYVLSPWECATIRGWRTSLDDIQQFVFVDEQSSYAARVGKANGDMGWVRVATFEEVRPLAVCPPAPAWDRDPSGLDAPESKDERAQNAPPASGAPEPARKEATRDLQGGGRGELSRQDANESVPGTGWGEHRFDRVERTEFLAADHFTDQLIFRYEYASGLEALGIFPHQHRVWERENGSLGFVPAPR